MKSIEKYTPFASPIWKFNIGAIERADVDRAYEIEKQMPSNKVSNVGGYQSPNLDLCNTHSLIDKKLTEVVKVIAHDINCDLQLDNSWLNINRKNHYNIEHVHRDCAFSGVVYLQANAESGKIVFRNPANTDLIPICDTVPDFFGTYFFQPQIGDVLIFPAYLRHFVEPNMSEEDRISIAFNLKMNYAQ